MRREKSDPFLVQTLPGRFANPDLPEQLREQFSDRAATFLRAIVSELPVGGGLVSELVGRIIPNQREERMYAFIAGLAQKLEALDLALEPLLEELSADKAALFEDGVAGAVSATTEARIRQLVDLVAKGLVSGGRDAEDQRSVVRLLNDLSEADVRYLMSWITRYHQDPAWRKANGFDFKFEEREFEVDSSSGPKTVKKLVPVGDVMDPIAEMSTQGRLEALGLFERRVIQAHEGASRRGDRFEYDVNVSDAGMALLQRLGLIETGDERAHAWRD